MAFILQVDEKAQLNRVKIRHLLTDRNVIITIV